MKRLFVMLLAFLMLFGGFNTLAETDTTQEVGTEEFTLRNGIKFGMSREEVSNLELENGTELRTVKSRPIYALKADGVTVSGDDGCSLSFNFTDDKLDSMAYWLTGNANNYYSTLCGKYGSPLIDVASEYVAIGEAPTAYDYIKKLWVDEGWKASSPTYVQWWYPNGEDSYIDILLMVVDIQKGEPSNTHTVKILSYTYRTNAELSKAVEAATAAAEESKNDL